MIFLNKNLLPTCALVCLLPISIQSTHAASAYSDSAIFNVTVTGLSNLTTAGDFTELSHSWVPFADDYSETIPTGNAVYNTTYNSTPIVLPLSTGDVFSQSFTGSGTVGNGTLAAYYESTSELGFSNDSATETYQIDLTIDYILSASATSDLASITDLADTDVYLDYTNEDGTFWGDNSAYASAFAAASSGATDSLTFSVLLAPGEFETLYTFSTISGTLSAVPVPAAVWFFGSALISLTGIRKLKNTA